MRREPGEGRVAELFVRLNRARERWRDPSLSVLLGVQAVVVFGLSPATAMGLPVPPGLSVVLLLVFMSLVILMARGRWTLTAGLGTLALTGVSLVLQSWNRSVPVRIGGELAAVATFAALCVVVFGAAFGPGTFNNHRIRGAVLLYLTVGMLFAVVHRVIAELSPDAYSNLPAADHVAAFRAAVDYFSFSTLTSLGFGDIAPVQPFARSLATLEAAFGQLYPATFIARVVMLELSGRA